MPISGKGNQIPYQTCFGTSKQNAIRNAVISVSSSLNLPYAKTRGGDISQSSCKFNKFIVKQFFIKDIGKLCPYSGLGRTDT